MFYSVKILNFEADEPVLHRFSVSSLNFAFEKILDSYSIYLNKYEYICFEISREVKDHSFPSCSFYFYDDHLNVISFNSTLRPDYIRLVSFLRNFRRCSCPLEYKINLII